MQAAKREGAYLEHLCAQSVLVKVCLGQAFEGVFTAVSHWGGKGRDVIEVDSTDRREIFGWGWVPRQDLTDLVDDSIASGTESPDNLKLDRGSIKVVVAVEMAGRNREKANPFTVKIKTLTDDITWEENVLHWRGVTGTGSRVLERDIGTGGVERRKNGRTRNGTGRRDTSRVRREGNGRRPGRSSDGGGRIDGEHAVGRLCGTISRQMTTSAIGRLSGGERLRILWAEREVGQGDGVLQHC